MTDIEKRAFKITLIRAATIGLSLVACTWKLSAVFNRFIDKMDRIEAFVQAQAKKDSIRDGQITQLLGYRAIDRHDMDSIGRVLKRVTLKVMPAEYYTQRMVNGRLITEQVN